RDRQAAPFHHTAGAGGARCVGSNRKVRQGTVGSGRGAPPPQVEGNRAGGLARWAQTVARTGPARQLNRTACRPPAEHPGSFPSPWTTRGPNNERPIHVDRAFRVGGAEGDRTLGL